MDEELAQWASDWKTLKANDMQLTQTYVRAHRTEAALQLLFTAVAVVSMALFIGGALALLAYSPRPLGARTIVTASLALLLGVCTPWIVWVWRRQTRQAQRQLTASPSGIVDDMIRLRERELWWWRSRFSLGMAALMLVAANVVLVSTRGLLGSPAGWGLLGYQAIVIGATAWFARRRVPFLEADLDALRAVREDLE